MTAAKMINQPSADAQGRTAIRGPSEVYPFGAAGCRKTQIATTLGIEACKRHFKVAF